MKEKIKSILYNSIDAIIGGTIGTIITLLVIDIVLYSAAFISESFVSALLGGFITVIISLITLFDRRKDNDHNATMSSLDRSIEGYNHNRDLRMESGGNIRDARIEGGRMINDICKRITEIKMTDTEKKRYVELMEAMAIDLSVPKGAILYNEYYDKLTSEKEIIIEAYTYILPGGEDEIKDALDKADGIITELRNTQKRNSEMARDSTSTETTIPIPIEKNEKNTGYFPTPTYAGTSTEGISMKPSDEKGTLSEELYMISSNSIEGKKEKTV